MDNSTESQNLHSSLTRTISFYHIAYITVNKNVEENWDGQGTSYLPEEDKMYDLGLLSEVRKKIQGQGMAKKALSREIAKRYLTGVFRRL